jgi:hypothetical protein
MTLSVRTTLLTVAVACLLPASALAVAKPTVITGTSTNLSPDAATVTGALNPNGLVTTWYFQYGRTKSYGSRTTAQDAGSGTKRVGVSSTLTGLANKTTYHYRLVATNSQGTTFGGDRTFRTPETPTVSTIASSANPAVFGQGVVITGFLVGPRGGGGKQVALQAKAFPFTGQFQQVGNTVVTAADGSYTFQFGALLNVQLQVVDRSDASIVSPVLTQNVAIRTSLKVKRRSGSRSVRFSGHVSPAGATSAVVIQKRTRRGGWKNVTAILPRRAAAGATANRFSKRIRVRRGIFRAVARPGSGAYVEGASRRVRVRG